VEIDRTQQAIGKALFELYSTLKTQKQLAAYHILYGHIQKLHRTTLQSGGSMNVIQGEGDTVANVVVKAYAR
jgi:hypothetical protein